jgi:hypothetical protein
VQQFELNPVKSTKASPSLVGLAFVFVCTLSNVGESANRRRALRGGAAQDKSLRKLHEKTNSIVKFLRIAINLPPLRLCIYSKFLQILLT